MSNQLDRIEHLRQQLADVSVALAQFDNPTFRERLAQAIFTADPEGPDRPGQRLTDTHPAVRKAYKGMADAAIAAFRELLK